MKVFHSLTLVAASVVFVSCSGLQKEDETALIATPAPATKPNPRPERPPPPPQPQDGSMIVTPGGTSNLSVPDVSDEDKENAIDAAEREIARRKEDASEGDDLVSKALQSIEEDDLDRAFSELKKAVDKYPSAGTGE